LTEFSNFFLLRSFYCFPTCNRYTFNLDGDVTDYPQGSQARADLVSNFIADIARALNLRDSSRISILSITSGSIIITFSIAAPTDEADLIASQISALLELQMETPGSILLSGLVTSLINTQKSLPLLVFLSEATSSVVEIDGVITYIDDATGLPLPVQPTEKEETVNILVTDYREAGSFEFGSRTYAVAETTAYVVVDVQRNHGSRGRVEIDYHSINGTASGDGIDYHNVNGTLIFATNERTKFIQVPIQDDAIIEEHLEQFTLELTAVRVIIDLNDLSLPPIGGLGSPIRTAVSIYDYGDRIERASTTFPTSPGGDRAHLKGWRVTGNGNRNPAWLDPDGLYSVDQSFNGIGAKFSGMTDSLMINDNENNGNNVNNNNNNNRTCDGNVGGSSSTRGPSSGIRFDGGGANEMGSGHHGGYAVTSGMMTNFPRSVFTVSLWMRSIDVKSLSTIISYVQLNDIHEGDNVTESTAGMTSDRWQEFAIQDQRNVRVIVRDYLHDTFDIEYEYVNDGTRNGRRTSNIGKMNDGTWHFLSVTWSGDDHRVKIFVDTVLSYEVEIHPQVDMLSSTGVLAVGASVRGNCFNDPTSTLLTNNDRGVCGLVQGTHFIGSIQGVRIWGVELTEKQRSLEMQVSFCLLLWEGYLFLYFSFSFFFFISFLSSFKVFLRHIVHIESNIFGCFC